MNVQSVFVVESSIFCVLLSYCRTRRFGFGLVLGFDASYLARFSRSSLFLFVTD